MGIRANNFQRKMGLPRTIKGLQGRPDAYLNLCKDMPPEGMAVVKNPVVDSNDIGLLEAYQNNYIGSLNPKGHKDT